MDFFSQGLEGGDQQVTLHYPPQSWSSRRWSIIKDDVEEFDDFLAKKKTVGSCLLAIGSPCVSYRLPRCHNKFLIYNNTMSLKTNTKKKFHKNDFKSTLIEVQYESVTVISLEFDFNFNLI